MLRARQSGPLRGRLRVPGDKSISHRALILGALAVGETRISGLLEGEDVRRTAAVLALLGAGMEREGEGNWRVRGLGVGGFQTPESALDLGNSGTGARLLLGAVAGVPITATLIGDASLSRRPMGRVIAPLRQMGAQIIARTGPGGGACMPVTITGAASVLPIVYRLPVASAQVKSAVLLAGLMAPGETSVIEPEPTRDHSERLLRHFGAEVAVADSAEGRVVTLTGQPELSARAVAVPGDPSSAAFPLVAALLLPGSEITIEGVGVNPLRAGLFETLREMGADLDLVNPRVEGGEPVADLIARASALRGIVVPPERAPAMIDEYPILAIAAACAAGRTEMRGLAELRVKESDRLRATARGLTACGVAVEEIEDGLIVSGRGAAALVPGGGLIATEMDHRIAMAFLVLGLGAAAPVTIDDGRMIATSFPGFAALMAGLGARIETGPETEPATGDETALGGAGA